jgi:hypothetical protein
MWPSEAHRVVFANKQNHCPAPQALFFELPFLWPLTVYLTRLMASSKFKLYHVRVSLLKKARAKTPRRKVTLEINL